jgi:hypothetical protein
VPISKLDLASAFLDRVPIAGVDFLHNDYVRIIGGENFGNTGSLVTLLTLSPEPLFVVELESGLDVKIPQSELSLIKGQEHG